MGYIYKITNLINGKEYIGKTNLTIEDRFKTHIEDSTKRKNEKRPLYDAMNKYGIENFIVEKVEECSENLLNEKEKYWIEHYNTFHNGYNATLGGEGKTLIDYKKILEMHKQGLTLKEIREETHHDLEQLSKILKSQGVSLQEIKENANNKMKKTVFRRDKKSNEVLQIFNGVSEASKWVIDNGYSKDKLDGISAHICQCCNGIRKSAYKFNWSYEE